MNLHEWLWTLLLPTVWLGGMTVLIIQGISR